MASSSSSSSQQPPRSWMMLHLLLCMGVSMAFLGYQYASGVAPASLMELAGPSSSPATPSAAAAAMAEVVSADGLHRFSHVPYDSSLPPSSLSSLRWGIIFDAGSTGSRVHVYRFRLPDDPALQPLLEDEIFVEVKPGLSAYVPSGVGSEKSSRDVGAPSSLTAALTGPRASAESLRSLLELCKSSIPSWAHARTPIALRATAGLRLLGPEVSEGILEAIRDLFALYPFAFRRAAPGQEGQDVDVMNGSDEGVFAWITVNYLAHKLQDFKPGDAAVVVQRPKTSAILDLGGASTQIVFEPDSVSLADLDPAHLGRLFSLGYGHNNSYTLFENSYLGFGLMEARRKIKNNIATHPALQVHPLVRTTASKEKGVELASFTAEGVPILYHPCLSDVHEELIDVVDPSDSVSKKVLLKGHALGHASCAEVARTLFVKDAPCTTQPYCSFGGHFALPLHGMFASHSSSSPAASTSSTASSPNSGAPIYAFSYFYDRTLDLFDLPEEVGPLASADGGGTVVRLERFRHLADRVCAFSMKGGAAEATIKTAAQVEREKEEARRIVQQIVQDQIEHKHKAGCATVTVKRKDGSVRLVAVPSSAASSSPSPPDAAPASTPASSSLLRPTLAADEEGACMVEEAPDLSPEAEAARLAHVPSKLLVDIIGANPYLCLDLTYAHTLLHYGYDLPETFDLHIMKRLQKKEIGWCLGAMLAQMAQNGW